MLSIIITLNQTKPKPAREVQKYLLNFYVFILHSGFKLCVSCCLLGLKVQILPCHKVAVLAVFLTWLETRSSGNLTRKPSVSVHRQLNPPEKQWVRHWLEEKPLLKSEHAAGGQLGSSYTSLAEAEILEVALSRTGRGALGFEKSLDDFGTQSPLIASLNLGF